MKTGISELIDKLNYQLCLIASKATVVMALLTFVIVALRYGVGVGWIALQESVMYLHASVFMLGSAYTLNDNSHVRVDVFYRKFSPVQQAWVNIGGAVLLLIPVCVFILVYSFSYVAESWRLLEGSKEAGGLPLVFVLKTLIPLAAITLLLQGVSEIIKSLNQLRSGEPC